MATFESRVRRHVQHMADLTLVLAICISWQRAASGDTYEQYANPRMLVGMSSQTARAAPDGTTPNTRTTIGVGEVVTCSINPDMFEDEDWNATTQQVVYDTIGDRVWASNGLGSITPSGVTSVNATTLTAELNPGICVVLVHVYNQPTYFSDASPAVTSLTFNVIMPQGETTVDHGWDACVSNFGSTLSPLSVSFSGRTVYEGSETGTDGCYFAGSTYPPVISLSGGAWTVNASNAWGDDHMTWGTTRITYYRGQGRAPCNTTIPQRMFVFGSTSGSYAGSNVRWEIGASTLTNTRNGCDMTRDY
jgi:hypothetical protein